MEYPAMAGGFVHKLRKTRGLNGLKNVNLQEHSSDKDPQLYLNGILNNISPTSSLKSCPTSPLVLSGGSSSNSNSSTGSHVSFYSNQNSSDSAPNFHQPSTAALGVSTVSTPLSTSFDTSFPSAFPASPPSSTPNMLFPSLPNSHPHLIGNDALLQRNSEMLHCQLSEAGVVSSPSMTLATAALALSSLQQHGGSQQHNQHQLLQQIGGLSLPSHMPPVSSTGHYLQSVDIKPDLDNLGSSLNSVTSGSGNGPVISHTDLQQLAASGRLVTGQNGQLFMVVPNDAQVLAAAMAAGISPHLSADASPSSPASTTSVDPRHPAASGPPPGASAGGHTYYLPAVHSTSASSSRSSPVYHNQSVTSPSIGTKPWIDDVTVIKASPSPNYAGGRNGACRDGDSLRSNQVSSTDSHYSMNGKSTGLLDSLGTKDIRRRVSHNEVERRRRDRINTWIGELQKLLPPEEQSRSQQHSKGAVLKRVCEYFRQVSTSMRQLEATKWRAEQHQQDNNLLQTTVNQLQMENQYLRNRLHRISAGSPSAPGGPNSPLSAPISVSLGAGLPKGDNNNNPNDTQITQENYRPSLVQANGTRSATACQNPESLYIPNSCHIVPQKP